MAAGKLEIVTSDNSEIGKHLAGIDPNRVLVNHCSASSVEQLWHAIEVNSPTLVILQAVLAGGMSGYSLCRRIKDHKKLQHTHVIIVCESGLSVVEESLVRQSGCDEVIALPMHSDDFYTHLSQLTGLSMRQSRRVHVALKVKVKTGRKTTSGKVSNLSTTGLGLQFSKLVPRGFAEVTISHNNKTYGNITGDILWCLKNQKAFTAGMKFLSVPQETRDLMNRLALYHTKQHEDNERDLSVIMQGDLDENSDLSELLNTLQEVSYVDFMLADVEHITERGWRIWCEFIAQLPEQLRYSFRQCSLPFVAKLRGTPQVLARAELRSFIAPYQCKQCQRSDKLLLEARLVQRPEGTFYAPPVRCHRCSDPLEFSESPESFFAFLAA